ncbi:3-oxoacid CoA-transferase subunit B [Bradyrhizobium zhanjiangense]|uniref:3-oxoacid CoA-transferase subunit B n=1 Tax=Bradyrhizobium zhanjiangense TaxID=1325107 RepID=UPI001008EE88|nr:3-oxoacid CoA-transferase subunit B [Bradyrhizobium zhanjiangense]
MTYTAWTRNEIAQLIAANIPEGSVVNIGIGMPELVANYLKPEKDIILHSENGILGMGPMAADAQVDGDLINAGKKPVTLMPGGCFFDHAISFGMMRGGHLDFAILGGLQVSETADLANWSTGETNAIPAVGGAMDLAVGAKQVFIMMELLTKQGQSKLVRRCTYPLTGVACVKRVYTDLAVFDLTPNGFMVRAMAPGMTLRRLQELSALKLNE